MKPKILLSFSNANNGSTQKYMDAVEAAGGEPHGMYLPEVSADYDGLLLCGGVDVHPKYYGEEIDGTQTIDLERDIAEFKLLKAFTDAGKPVMGICRGHQVINVFFGGSLIQDLPNGEEHHNGEPDGAVNKILAEEGSLFEKLYGREFTVNSFHHQAIKKAGSGYRCTAACGEVVEAAEHETLPVFSVQWHPERLCSDVNPCGMCDGRKLFEHFISLCLAYQKK